MIEQVVELIDRYTVIHGEDPLLVSLHPQDWAQLHQDVSTRTAQLPMTDSNFYLGNILVGGIPVVRCGTVERL